MKEGVQPWKECDKRGWWLESDGGGADGWTARVYRNDDVECHFPLAERQAHSRSQARKLAVIAAIEAESNTEGNRKW